MCRHTPDARRFARRCLSLGAVLVAGCAAAGPPVARANPLCGDLSEPVRRERCFDDAAERRTSDPAGALDRFVEVCEAGMVDACAEATRLAVEQHDGATARRVRERAPTWCEGRGLGGASATHDALGRTCSYAARLQAEIAPANLPRAHALWQRACQRDGLVAACMVLVHGFGEPVDIASIVAARQQGEEQRRHAEDAWTHANAVGTASRGSAGRDWLLPHGLGDAAASWLSLGFDPMTALGEAGSAHAPASATNGSTQDDASAVVQCNSCPSRCEPLTRRCRASEARVCAAAAACVCLCEHAAGGCALPRWVVTSCVSMNAPVP